MAIKKLVQHDGCLAFLRVSEWLYFLRGLSCCQVAVVNIFFYVDRALLLVMLSGDSYSYSVKRGKIQQVSAFLILNVKSLL